MVSICRKRGSVGLIESWRTLAFWERGILVDEIVQVIEDTIALVSELVERSRIHLLQSLAGNFTLSTYICRTAFP